MYLGGDSIFKNVLAKLTATGACASIYVNDSQPKEAAMSAQVYTSAPTFTDGQVLQNHPADTSGALRTDTGKRAYPLLSGANGATTGASTGPVSGGNYSWAYEADNWNGGSIKLQRKNLRGNWVDAPELGGAKTADGSAQFGIPHGLEVRAVTTGAPVNVWSNIAGV